MHWGAAEGCETKVVIGADGIPKLGLQINRSPTSPDPTGPDCHPEIVAAKECISKVGKPLWEPFNKQLPF
jgi:hypothetical protein